MSADPKKAHNFIQNLIEDAIRTGEHTGKVITRFPPEPNGYLHIGHAKSICLNFEIARTFGGECNLRFDDTNPEKESQEYIEAIQRDVTWLGYTWTGEVRYASDYFEAIYEAAEELILKDKAYVCALTAEDMTRYRGTLKEPGQNSPYRDRPIEESLQMFRDMRAGKYQNGELVLRAKIDMASPNINMRDPILYRIRYAEHHQTGNTWCIYPMYDFTHPISDALEGITHSLCTLEFEDHRPLYDWVLENITVPCQPRQIEFSRLNPNYSVTSKRRLKILVDEGHVEGWDDPRMPTISGMRRRGYTAASIRNFCEAAGVTRSLGTTDVSMLEFHVRDDLDKNAPRAMCVLRPLKIVLTNYPEDKTEELSAPAHPNRDDLGTRVLPFSREIYIDQEDFREEANKKYKRLVLGKKVRLRNAYVIEAQEVIKDEQGNIIEVHCHCDLDTLGKDPADGVKPKGVIHWVCARQNLNCQIRLYDRLFIDETPGAGGADFLESLNPNSLQILENCKAEIGLSKATLDDHYQFEREGYFYLDSKYSTAEYPVFNQTIGLKDSWEKQSADSK